MEAYYSSGETIKWWLGGEPVEREERFEEQHREMPDRPPAPAMGVRDKIARARVEDPRVVPRQAEGPEMRCMRVEDPRVMRKPAEGPDVECVRVGKDPRVMLQPVESVAATWTPHDLVDGLRMETAATRTPHDVCDGLPEGIATLGTPRDVFTSTPAAPEEVRGHLGTVTATLMTVMRTVGELEPGISLPRTLEASQPRVGDEERRNDGEMEAHREEKGTTGRAPHINEVIVWRPTPW